MNEIWNYLENKLNLIIEQNMENYEILNSSLIVMKYMLNEDLYTELEKEMLNAKLDNNGIFNVTFGLAVFIQQSSIAYIYEIYIYVIALHKN